MAGHFDHLAEQLPLAAWCGSTGVSVSTLLLVTGFVGGFAHCGPMCGPFVLMQTAALADGPLLGRLGGAMLLPYHAGRIATYTALGALAGAFGNAIAATAPLRITVAVMLQFAGLLFLGQAIVRLASAFLPGHAAIAAKRWGVVLAGLAKPLLAASAARGRFLLGMVLGLLPCGFLFAALAAAAATQTPQTGALAMAAFGLGTVPSLAAIGFGGAAVSGRWRGVASRMVSPLLLFNAAALTAIAWQSVLRAV